MVGKGRDDRFETFKTSTGYSVESWSAVVVLVRRAAAQKNPAPEVGGQLVCSESGLVDGQAGGDGSRVEQRS